MMLSLSPKECEIWTALQVKRGASSSSRKLPFGMVALSIGNNTNITADPVFNASKDCPSHPPSFKAPGLPSRVNFGAIAHDLQLFTHFSKREKELLNANSFSMVD